MALDRATARGNWALQARLLMLAALLMGCALVLLTRLYVFQVLEHERYSALAREEHRERIPIVPKRGAILDGQGNPLVVSVMFEGVYAVGSQIRDREQTARALAPVLELSQQEIVEKIDPASKRPVALRSPVPAATSAKVEALRLPGILLQRVPYRRYPEGSLAAQLLGFVGTDFQGLSGLELSLDQELAGQPGYIDTERDTAGQELVLARRLSVPPTDGATVVLTLDRYLQRAAERALERGLEEQKSAFKSGIIIIMEPSTGAVLAAASRPTFKLTNDVIYDPGEAELYRPAIVTDMYEPGSVMKIVTMSAGIDEGVITPQTRYEDTGLARVGGAIIHNWDGAANGSITMTEVLIHSSNVGTQHVSGLLGPERFYEYVERFGFGRPTGIQLPGESPGLVRSYRDPGWGRIDLATNSYGQGIAVTPLQMLTAVSALANGGVLMQPTLVKEVRANGQTQRVAPTTVRRVVSEQTARSLTEMMIAVAQQPALEAYRLPGYVLAAKTGTSDFPTATGYTSGKTYASVVAFAPAHRPRFSILIRIDGPEALYGGVVAMPVLKSLASEIFSYLRIPAEPLPAGTQTAP
ncbi:MAG: penicillin-binding protein 2 [Chloroflexi bacterium]|nr:penicillin-binding protein 2 [Chloroflexota bacterium]